MIALSYHLENPYRAVERETKAAWFFSFLFSFIEYAKRHYKEKLDFLYVTLLGMLGVIDDIKPEQAKEELKSIKKIQTALLKLEYYLEKTNYFDDTEIKEKWNKCLDAMYKLEGEVRIKAFSAEPKVKSDDASFIYQITQKSKQNIGDILASYAV
jgi:hypothetical protein